jgi:hypothetical protein
MFVTGRRKIAAVFGCVIWRKFMRLQPKILVAAALVLALAASSAIAGGNRRGPQGHAVPGPIAGAGLGYLALAGGYYLYRRWRNTGE